jgi:guanylate kinase
VSIFVLPPSAAALNNRLVGRGENEDTIRQRLAKARWEMSHYRDYDYLVVNDEFDTALAELSCIVRAERMRLARQEARLGSLLTDLLSEHNDDA